METTGNTQQFLKKLKPGPPYDPTIPHVGIDPKELKAETQTDTGTPKFTAARMRKRPKGPQPGVDKQNAVPTHEGILFSLKQEGSADTGHKPEGP